jgi:hypothetical protein
MPQMAIWSPFDEFEVGDEFGLKPQCRMPDYAVWVLRTVVITAFSVTLFGITRLSMRKWSH